MGWGTRVGLIGLDIAAGCLVGCGGGPHGADLAAIYNDAAQNIGDERNPVVVLPGVLGSKLEEPTTNQPIWGAFIYGAADADTAEGARWAPSFVVRALGIRSRSEAPLVRVQRSEARENGALSRPAPKDTG